MFAAGLVIRDLPLVASNWRSTQDLPAYLREQNVVAIADIDTRKLTRILREKGAQDGCVMAGKIDEKAALQAAREFPGLAGMDLAKVVSCTKPYTWTESTWTLGQGYGRQAAPTCHVVAYDYGVKRNILRMLAERGCRLTVIPAQSTAQDAPALEKPDGIFSSRTVPAIRNPAITRFARYANSSIRASRCSASVSVISCSAFAKAAQDAENEIRSSWRKPSSAEGSGQRARDDYEPEPRLRRRRGNAAGERAHHAQITVRRHAAGFYAHRSICLLCFQGHPEASPGPRDVGYLFDRFVALMEKQSSAARSMGGATATIS